MLCLKASYQYDFNFHDTLIKYFPILDEISIRKWRGKINQIANKVRV